MRKRTLKNTKQNNNLHKYLPKKDKSQEKSQAVVVPKNQGKKKMNSSLNEFLTIKETNPSPAPLPRKWSLQYIVKQIQIQQILQKCPKLQQLTKDFSVETQLPREIIGKILKKYLQSSPHSLWSASYAPKQISELFNIQAGNKIKDWINAFFEYKHKIVDEDSFINECSSETMNKNYRVVQENQWDLVALIVRGRPGVGKTSAIRAVAKQMSIDLQECGSDYNQTKYLKEKNQSTQSESVKNAYLKKTKVEKNAQMITKFMPAVEKEKDKENRKSQMIHNVSLIFPMSESQKFHNELSRCISLSKIPFILTNSGEKMPKECYKYDIIDFQSGHKSSIHKILWLIYHLQSLPLFNRNIQVQKQHIFDEINSQPAQFVINELCPLHKIEQVCELFNYRLDYIFTFLQHHRENFNNLQIYHMLVDKFKTINQDQLLQEIRFIDFEKVFLNKMEVVQVQKFEDTIESSQCEKTKEDRQVFFEDYKRRISLIASEDAIPLEPEHSFTRFSFSPQQWQNHPYTCIDISIHRGIKDSLAKMANKQIGYVHQKFKSSLKASQIAYLPMLVKQKRTNRTCKANVDALRKTYDQNQFCYLHKFGHFIRQK